MSLLLRPSAAPLRRSTQYSSHISHRIAINTFKMLSQAAARTTTSLVTRRGFHATRARMSSPYHYPEGPYTNIPFNPRGKWFAAKYWGFMAVGFGAPFGIAVYQTYKEQ